ncbi:MAG: biopolymer transporter ExbD [Proteobacteria bacterium]|nr:biopolymer transporter ExbD [Pseudomonadota bacterium]
MAVGSGSKRKIPVFRNLNLTPLLDFVVAVIPVLLLSVNFLEYVVLDTSLPVYSDDPTVELQKDNQPKLGLSIAITDEGFIIAGQGGVLSSDGKGTIIRKTTDGLYNYLELVNKLLEIKNNYPDEWSVIIIPEATTRFEDIVSTMDASREHLSTSSRGKAMRKVMFPNVVLGGGIL